MKNDKSIFTPDQIDAMYINSLVDLINACRTVNVEVDKISHFQNGWIVTFKGFDNADAVCHDGSYGNPISDRYFEANKYHNDWTEHGNWETIGFPWDYNDVSVHSSQELALYISALKNGTNIWERDKHEDEDC